MLALVRDIKTDAPVAIHRTALNLDGKYPERIDRMSLGPTSGGAIKISPDDEVHCGLLIGEGIETVLAASKTFQFKPVWSLIDRGNLAKFPVLSGIECVTIAVDNDAPGQEAAAECARRLVGTGIEVISTQTNFAKDFNDMVIRKGANV
jgi:putative DNA primase/helicase